MESLPPWPIVQSLLLTVVLPGFGLGAGLPAVICAATRSEPVRRVGAALGLAGGLALGNFLGSLLPWGSWECGWPSLFPATLAVVFGAVAAALISSSAPGRGGGAAGVLRLRWLLLGAGAWWLTPAAAPGSRLGLFLLLFGASALHWEASRRTAARAGGGATMLACFVPWGAAAAIVLIHAASARFFDLAVLLTATLAGVAVVATRTKLLVDDLLAGPALFLPALALSGAANTYSEVPLASFVLIALAPALLWGLLLTPMRRWSGHRLIAAAAIAMIVPCAVAVALAMRAETLDFGR